MNSEMKKFYFILTLILVTLGVNATQYTYTPSKGIVFSWQYDDPIALFTDEGVRIKFWAINANGNNTQFDAYGWGLTQNSAFTAYSPYTKQSGTTPETALPMTYDGQKQLFNNNTTHLAAFDYMKTPRTMSTSSALNLQFQHLGSIIRFEIAMQQTQILTSLTLNTETPITLSLDKIRVSQGGVLQAYMMVPPFTVPEEGITLTITNVEGEVAEIQLGGTTVAAGKCYPVPLECPEFVAQTKAKPVVNNAKGSVMPADHPMTTATDDPILYPTAYAPNFEIDTEHPLALYVEKHKLLGDVNDDGRVMVNDAVLLINYYLKDEVAGLDKEVCDVNGDGVINVADAVAIVNIYLKAE